MDKTLICKVCELPFIKKDEQSTGVWYRCTNLYCPLSGGWIEEKHGIKIYRLVKPAQSGLGVEEEKK